jgi:hypothetical protein
MNNKCLTLRHESNDWSNCKGSMPSTPNDSYEKVCATDQVASVTPNEFIKMT